MVHDGVLDGNNKGIGFEIIDSAGAELANGQVNIVTSGAQHSVDVAALPNGGFAVVWVDPSGTGLDTSGTAIKLQVFDGLGSMRGVETLVNTVKGLDQVEPSIEALSDGRLIVSWRDNSSSKAVPNSAVIRAQIIDPREGQVIGNDLVNTLYGHDTQPDNIEGRGADDVLSGLGGADEIHGGAGDDMLIGGIGGDLLDGGDDSDTADYRLSGKGQVAISLLADTASGGDAEGDALDGIENLFGSLTLRDILIGDDGGNRISGFGGIDSIRGEGGNDNLEGGAGGDSLNGGAGIGDTAIYRNSNLGIVNVNLLLGTASGGEADSDSLFFIENLDGSATQRDILIGSDVANVLSGNGGNDSIRGEGGADTISGGAGADGLNGGSGTDTVDYTNSDAGVAVDLNVATQASGGHANGDTLFFFENIFGSRFGDTLRGTMTANRLSGSNGSDTLNGREGSDYLTGGTEADTFRFDVTALGVDTIVDWQDGLDKISIGALVETSYAGLAIEAQGTTRVIIRGLNGTGAIAVESASAFTLDAGDFMFV